MIDEHDRRPDERWAGPLDSWFQAPAELLLVREFDSRYGHSHAEHHLVDDQGHVIVFWSRRVHGEVGDRGDLRGKVSRHLVDFGRPLTQLTEAKFIPIDPNAVDFDEHLADGLGAARWGQHRRLAPADVRKRLGVPAQRAARPGGRPPLELDDPPDTGRPPPEIPDKRFQHLDLEEARQRLDQEVDDGLPLPRFSHLEMDEEQ